MKPSQSRAEATTPVSRRRPSGSWFRWAFHALARLSLAVSSLPMATGCLIEDPPPYREPTRTRPQLDMRAATPSQNAIYVIGQGDTIPFTVPFISEDAGSQILAFLFFDGQKVADEYFPAGTLDERGRQIVLTYEPTSNMVPFGCHRVLMRVSQEDNFSRSDTGEPLDPEYVAEATWWVNLIDIANGDDGSVLRNCPTATQGTVR